MEQTIGLPPPKIMVVPEKFAKELGPETVRGIVVANFVKEFFGQVVEAVDGKNVGLRAIYVSNQEGSVVNVSDWNGPTKIKVSTLDKILEQGGEYEGLSVVVTKVGVNDELGNPEIDMTEEYLRFATNNSLLANENIAPAVLVYDLSMATSEAGTYRITYPDFETKVKSLLAVYPMEISQLRDRFNE